MIRGPVPARRGRPVPQWSVPKRELREQIRKAKGEAAAYPAELNLPTMTDDVRARSIRIPTTFPGTLSDENPMVYLDEVFCDQKSYYVRKNQRHLTGNEWTRYLDAFERLLWGGRAELLNLWDGPTLEDFVEIHVQAMETHEGMAWGAHSMGVHNGRNFLSWHREYLAKFEAALMWVNPSVTIPYWNWVEDPELPEPLSDYFEMLYRFGVTRDPDYNADDMPTAGMVNSALAEETYADLRSNLEGPGPDRNHNLVHNIVGGTMMTTGSPAHPVFWLHHAFLDKLWADRQSSHGSEGHPENMDEVLQPGPIMTRTVFSVVATKNLGYVYD